MKPSQIRIAPSILSADFGHLADEVKAVTQAGADLIHVDVMDGHFVPNLTLGPLIVKAVRRATALPLDVHLMIEHPEQWVDEYAAAGADIMHVHAEACRHLHRVVQQIKARGKKAAVAINPATSLSVLDYILEDLSAVLVMSVNPGFGGQAFIPQALDKISALRERLEKKNLGSCVAIEVDGGIKTDNFATAVNAGASVLVAGSAIFESKDYRQTMQDMRARAASSQT